MSLRTPSVPTSTPALATSRRLDADLSRRELLTLISAIMALTAAAIDLMLPAFNDIRSTFDLAEGSADTGKIVTVFFLGLAAAQIVWGPLADRFGRKPILYAGVGVYMLGAVGSALAPSYELLLVSRFVWGIGAAGTRVVASVIVRDRFVGDAMAKAMSRIMAVFVLVPILAPAIGSVVLLVLPWRGIFWVCVVWATVVTLWSLRLRESLQPAQRRPLSLRSTGEGFREVMRTPVTVGYTIAAVFLQGVFMTYLASSEVIISEIFDRRDQFPFVFGGVAVLFGVASLVNGRVVGTLGIDRVVTLVIRAMLPLCALLVITALAGNGVPQFWIFMPTLGLILAAFMFLIPNLESAAMVPVGHIAGTASALTGAVRIAAGAVLGTLISSQITESVTPFAIGVSAMCLSTSIAVWVVRYRASQRGRSTLHPGSGVISGMSSVAELGS
jgi:MFS transporter, DHA1 family, multidrug resistance protein